MNLVYNRKRGKRPQTLSGYCIPRLVPQGSVRTRTKISIRRPDLLQILYDSGGAVRKFRVSLSGDSVLQRRRRPDLLQILHDSGRSTMQCVISFPGLRRCLQLAISPYILRFLQDHLGSSSAVGFLRQEGSQR